MRRLAAVYENGTFGVQPDREMARSLKRKAAVAMKAVFPDYAVMQDGGLPLPLKYWVRGWKVWI